MYYNKKIEEIEKILKTNNKGLNEEEILKRQKKYGKNILPSKKRDSVFKLFIKEFKDPMIILLLFAVIISIVAGEIIDALVIMFIILVDAIIGTFEENKANNTAKSLSNLIKSKIKVIRNDRIIEINAEDLVLGDYAILESGNKISADMRIVKSNNLMIDESVLTGESIRVEKNNKLIKEDNITLSKQKNMVFSGSTIISGRALAIVTGVGLNTEIGKIADSINKSEKEKSPLTIRIEKLSKQISILVLIVAFFITILLLSKGTSYNEIFLTVIALSVSAMPEGLPLALTMALTIASNKMAKKNVVIRQLNAAESLGSSTVIASDKTGTLTVNEQTAKKIILPNNDEYDITGVGYNFDGEVIGKNLKLAKEIAFLGVINNESIINEKEKIGDSIDIAFKVLGEKLNVKTTNSNVLKIIPYESENKYSAVFYEKDKDTFCTVKGSLEVVKSFCKNINLTNEKIDSNILELQNKKLAKNGYRVIALATGKVKAKSSYSIFDIKNLTFMGMVGFIDPIRKDALESISKCKEAGIKVIMITGDDPLTAFSIARDLNLSNNKEKVTTGDELDINYEKGEETFDKFISEKIIFSRVTPLQKLKIVESLKRQGEFVAVTGDGVNDAPALKSANIGASMGSGTDIAKETADMIIIDDNFKSIVSGIKEGRVAYSNIRKIILFLISCGLSESLFFCLSIILDLPVPLLAVQLLWLNVVTDGLQDLALSFEKAESGILKEAPASPKESIFNKELLKEIIISGFLIGIIVFIVWYYLLTKLNMNVKVARAYIMTLMVFIQNIHVFNCRSEKNSVFSKSVKRNKLLLFSFFTSIFMQILIMEIPFLSKLLQVSNIPFIHLIYLFITSLLVLIGMEIYKKIKHYKTKF